MWEQAGVLFVTLNIPGGSNNDTDAWFGAAETDMQKQERKQRTEPTSAGSTPHSPRQRPTRWPAS